MSDKILKINDAGWLFAETFRTPMQVGVLANFTMPEDAGRTYTLLADVYVELGEPERAQELYELAVEYLKPANPSRYVADVYAKLASLHESEGRRDRAYDYMKLALGMQQQVAAGVHT